MIPLESLPDAVVVVDQTGIIARVNGHAEELFGYTRGEMIGQTLELLVPERFHGNHLRDRNNYLSTPRTRPMGKGNLTARRKNGEEVPVEIMLSPGGEGTVVAVVRDVSRRRQLERFRDEYLGYISHDLRNPLSVITLQARLVARLLANQGLAEIEQAVSVIAQSASFIEILVRELLEMSYLESDQVRLKREETDLSSFLKATLERTVSTSDAARVSLEVQGTLVASIDRARIERVVVNLVQNAIKYSPASSPIVVKVRESDGQGIVSVIDSGAGLTAEESSYVFDKYRRTASATQREGLGLGLYICRMIVETHGGKIGVTSVPGSGSTFYFSIPIAQQPSREQPTTVHIEPASAEAINRNLRGLKVLIVDDEPNAVSALVTLLAEEGLSPTGVTSPEQALLAVGKSQPDAVVLDVEMPGMSGLALLEQLHKILPGLPAVIMSGYLAHHAGIAQAREATGAAYIGKPVDLDELLRTLGRLFLGRAS